MKINSLNNDRVKEWSKLNTKKYRDEKNEFLVEGDHLVNEAIKNNLVKEIIIIEDFYFDTDLPKYEVTTSIMKKITNQVSISKIAAVCEKKKEKEINGNILILDGVQDPGNLGTIIRSAVAFGFDSIILGDDCVDLYNDKVIRSSEGMLFNINIIRENLLEFIPTLKNKNYQIISTDVTNGNNIKSINLNKKLAIILGNEGNGVKKEIADLCDEFLYIKMADGCESLNVGVAASIIMYEIANKE